MGLLDQPNVEFQGDPFVAMVKYNAMSEDEISVFPGNMVLVRSVFRDGWGLGQNLDTGAYGVLPLDTLRLADVIPSFKQPAHRLESRAYPVTSSVLSYRRDVRGASGSLRSHPSAGGDSRDALFSGGALYSGGTGAGAGSGWDGNGNGSGSGKVGSVNRESWSQETVIVEQKGETRGV
ncbi:hypothetical protein M427DRAFT_311452 [Gonapodya prolifera JEL478]|uniref:SH3 domain-containing protein n=1 Tax=Gonapodya prolifera (strain JEL478) TaxID=1344416 RepID=A0A139AWK6_GONPJ|nr:hypothetical protein M427DRAFT_311452 [Gonapodya prolifera JEL478]|eukprot:KXS21110.1 hypothetical protein M427DRAFT_311452 [Gonapodya prolifera JEL478]